MASVDNNDETYACTAFALCDNEAIGWVSSPIISYPTCQRCADKLGTEVLSFSLLEN